jgi:ATP-binding cassette subfamily C protein CydC
VSSQSLTILENSSELSVSGQMPAAMATLRRDEKSLFKATDASAKPAAFAAGLTEAAIGIALIACLILASVAFANGQLTATELGVVVLTPLAAFEAVAGLPAAAAQVYKSRAAASRIVALADAGSPAPAKRNRRKDQAAPEPQPEPDPHGDLIATDLSAGWPGHDPVLTHVDLTVHPGQAIGIVGPSGVGKTTLLATLAGLLPPEHGQVTLGGAQVDRLSSETRADSVAYIAEDAHIFATTVIENLRVARGDVTEDEALQVLDTAGLTDWLDALPHGLDTMLGGDGTTVSGGERRRLLLARALLSPARFILLDEPGEHLDSASADQLTAALLGVARSSGRGVLVVSHRVAALAVADEILVVEPGGIADRGDPKSLAASSRAFRLAQRAESLDN